MHTKSGYHWATWGDLNAFFGLAIDNITVLVIMSGILVFGFGFPADIIFTKMIPGTAFGVLVGDLAYTWLAFRLAKRTGNREVTAMPLGLDTPSTIGIALAVLGPTYVASHDAMITWHVGTATMIFMGIIKLIASFIGRFIQRTVPQAGLLGSLGGIGLVLLGFMPLMKMFALPIVGLVARGRLPFDIPGAFFSLLVGTALYHILGPLDLLGAPYHAPELAGLTVAMPWPTLGFVDGLGPALAYLPIAIPFGLLTVVGGINVTESARVAGDTYDTKSILLTEAIATLVAGLCGGVAQSTPYIGHPAYKAMGGRSAYTLATGLFVGLGGMLGLVSAIVTLLPEAAVTPILLFVGIEIVVQSFHASGEKHAPAVVLAYLPSVAEGSRILLAGFIADAALNPALLPAKAAGTLDLLNVLGHGFIVTAMLWGGAMACLLDKRFKAAAIYLLILAGFSLFGFIHSPMPSGEMFWPSAITSSTPFMLALSYGVLAVLLVIIAFKTHRQTRSV